MVRARFARPACSAADGVAVGGLIELFLMGALVAMVRACLFLPGGARSRAQVSEYWERYGESDSWKIKAVVWTSVLLNVLRTLQTIAALWHKVRPPSVCSVHRRPRACFLQLIADFGDYVLSATSSPWYSQLDPLTVRRRRTRCAPR